MWRINAVGPRRAHSSTCIDAHSVRHPERTPHPSHGEITAKYLGNGGDLLDGNVFAAGMCQVGIAGPVVDRGDTARREPGHVGPAILRPHHSPAAPTNSAAADGPGRAAPGGRVGEFDLDVEPVEYLMHVHERLLGAAIGSEPEIHSDRRRIGNHVPGDSAIDPYRGQSFPILTAVDIDDARLVRGQPVQYSSQFVNGVVPSQDLAECARVPRSG